jgi:hypothetical protein
LVFSQTKYKIDQYATENENAANILLVFDCGFEKNTISDIAIAVRKFTNPEKA